MCVKSTPQHDMPSGLQDEEKRDCVCKCPGYYRSTVPPTQHDMNAYLSHPCLDSVFARIVPRVLGGVTVWREERDKPITKRRRSQAQQSHEVQLLVAGVLACTPNAAYLQFRRTKQLLHVVYYWL